MDKAINIVSVAVIVILLLVFLSEKFFPIKGLELFYEKKFYLAIIYLILRVSRIYILRKSK